MMSVLPEPTAPPLFHYGINLDERIPEDHVLRRVKAILDLSFLDDMVRKHYGRCGHRSVPPQVIGRMLFLLFYYNIPSERELSRQLAYRMDMMWFLEMDIDQPALDHSVLSKARTRWGLEVFEQLFIRTVEQCAEAGLISGDLLHIDSTVVAANASKDSVVRGSPEWIAMLRRAFHEQERKLRPDEQPVTLVLATSSAAKPDEPSAPAQSSVVSEEAGAARPLSVNETHVSTTDPDADLARDKSGVTRLAYKEHRVVDDAFGVITAVASTGASQPDGAQLPSLYEQHQHNTGLEQTQVTITGDRHYGTASNYRYCIENDLVPHMAEAVNGVEGRGLFGQHHFTYEAQEDRFRCPAGQVLVLHQRHHKQRLQTYLIERAELCQNCPLRAQCTRSKNGRSLQVPDDYQVIAQARAEANSPAGKRSRKRRRHVMEGSFADAANNHGLKRARWRGQWRQKIQSWMIAAVQNLRILLKHGKKRPAKAAATLKKELNSSPAVKIVRFLLEPLLIPRFFPSGR